MNNPGIKPLFRSSPLAILAVAVVYAATAKVSFLFTIPPGNISPIFPAAGVALAAVMILGRKALIGVWLGSFAANTLSFYDGSVSSVQAGLAALLVGAFIGLGAMSGAGVGAFLVRRLCKEEHPLHGGRNVLILVTVGAFGSCMVSPSLGVLSLSLGGNVPWEQFAYSWVTWWVGDASGTLVAAPLILAWQQRHPFSRNTWRMLEASVLGAITFLVCYFVFFRRTPFEYGLLPLLLWAAFRFGMRGASTTAAAIALFAMVGTSRGTSPFVGGTVNESLLLLNSFFGVTITCTLFMAGMMEEQRRASKALRESEERLRLLGDNLPDSYVYQYTYAADGTPRFLYLSGGVEKLHGVKVEEVLRDARMLHRQIAPEQLLVMQAKEAASLKAMADFEMELQMQRVDGQGIWLQVCSRPRQESDGRIVWDGVAANITVRKRAEEAIIQSEERFRLIMDSLADLVAVLDVDGRRLYNSPSYRQILGDPDSLLGSSSFEQIHPEDRDRVRLSFRETVCTGVGQRLEYRMLDRTAQVHYIESQGSAMRDGQGRITKVLVVSRDVTERQRVHAALRESERKYRELVEHANSIILRWARDGRITFLNEFGQRFFGYTENEICGRHVIGTIVPESGNGGHDLHSLMEQICADPAAFEQNTNENMRRNGERVWIAWTNKVVLDPQGKVAEILSVGVDITARKRMEEELRETQATLERRVFLRTSELAAARDRAESADRTKSAFLATMSHELRTPLNSVIGFTGIMLQGLAGPLNAEQTKQLGLVKTSARHLLELINDVLDISKIEAGQIELQLVPFDLPTAIHKVVQTVTPLADRKNLPIIVQVSPEVGKITSDRRRVEQILLNLVSNAIKFTEKGQVEVSVERLGVMREGEKEMRDLRITDYGLRISISDTGPGIKPEDLDKLFQPFRQLDTGLTRQHEGTGLGLAICKRLVERLGGEIHVESEWGKGSTFSFTLLGVRVDT